MITLGLHAYTHDSAAALVRRRPGRGRGRGGALRRAQAHRRLSARRHRLLSPGGGDRALARWTRSPSPGGPRCDLLEAHREPAASTFRTASAACVPRGTAASGAASRSGTRSAGCPRRWPRSSAPRRARASAGSATTTATPRARSSCLPFASAAILTCDACGEWDTTVSYVGDGHARCEQLGAEGMPHSLGPRLRRGHRVPRLQGEVRRGQGDGAGRLRRARLRRRDGAHVLRLGRGGRLSVSTRYFRFHFDTKDTFYSRGHVRRCSVPPRRRGRAQPSATRTSPPRSRRRPSACSSPSSSSARRARATATSAWPAGWGSTRRRTGCLLEQGVVDRLFVQPAANDAGAALGAALLAVAGTRNPASGRRGDVLALPGPGHGPGGGRGGAHRAAGPAHARVADPEELAAELLAAARSWAGTRDAWSSGRGRWATARSSPTRGGRR